MNTKKLLIIEDHDAFREIVKDYLSMQDLDLDIHEAATAELGVMNALHNRPDIILMDIRLPGMNGIDAAARIKSYLPNCEIVILTMFETKAFKKVFKSKHVSAYIGKSELYEKLVPTIKKMIGQKFSVR